jgi:hypothetical protein
MMDITTHVNEPGLRVVPGPEVGMRRAVCQDCGAHAAVVAAGASITGACSVCGSGRLLALDEHLPPPRRWAS